MSLAPIISNVKEGIKLVEKVEAVSGHWGYALLVFIWGYIVASIGIIIREWLWLDIWSIYPIPIPEGNLFIWIFIYILDILAAGIAFKLADESYWEMFRNKFNEERIVRGEVKTAMSSNASYAYNACIIIVGVSVYLLSWVVVRYWVYEHDFGTWELWVLEILLASCLIAGTILFAYLAARKFDLTVRSTPGLTYGLRRD